LTRRIRRLAAPLLGVLRRRRLRRETVLDIGSTPVRKARLRDPEVCGNALDLNAEVTVPGD